MKTILFDASLCNGCYGCQFACKDEHCGNDWSPIAAEQPMAGQFWCRIEQEDRGKCPEVKVQYVPIICGQCDEAPCLEAAKDGAVYRREDGLVIIDPEKSKGQRQIMEACPAGCIYWNDELDIPQKCTGCAHLLDDGWSVPRCVDICATGALTYIDLEDAPEKAAVLPQLEAYHPHVMYINIPKRWIYGCFVDKAAEEVIIGAEVKLVNEAGTEIASVITDDFGEFRFKELEEGSYTVVICAEGFEKVALSADVSKKDVVFGDIFATTAA